jgi:hypothetical protein
MSGYDSERGRPLRDRQATARAALEQFLACVSRGDVAGVESLLAADARALSDGGGEFHANVKPVLGRVTKTMSLRTTLTAEHAETARDPFQRVSACSANSAVQFAKERFRNERCELSTFRTSGRDHDGLVRPRSVRRHTATSHA